MTNHPVLAGPPSLAKEGRVGCDAIEALFEKRVPSVDGG